MKNLLIFVLLSLIVGCELPDLVNPPPNLNGLTPDDIDCDNDPDFNQVEAFLHPNELFYLYEKSHPIFGLLSMPAILIQPKNYRITPAIGW